MSEEEIAKFFRKQLCSYVGAANPKTVDSLTVRTKGVLRELAARGHIQCVREGSVRVWTLSEEERQKVLVAQASIRERGIFGQKTSYEHSQTINALLGQQGIEELTDWVYSLDWVVPESAEQELKEMYGDDPEDWEPSMHPDCYQAYANECDPLGKYKVEFDFEPVFPVQYVQCHFTLEIE
jgi:hypothetical protein